MSSNDTDDIRSELQKYNQSTWGLVIYRCTYGDEAKWARFMTILNERSRAFLKSNDNLEDLMTSLDCSVQEDPSLDGASINEVRRFYLSNSSPQYLLSHHRSSIFLQALP